MADRDNQMKNRVVAPLAAHALGIAEVLAALCTDTVSGLSEPEAAKRLEKYGESLPVEKPTMALVEDGLGACDVNSLRSRVRRKSGVTGK